jgi:hypothetical protein
LLIAVAVEPVPEPAPGIGIFTPGIERLLKLAPLLPGMLIPGIGSACAGSVAVSVKLPTKPRYKTHSVVLFMISLS